ncbi:hypothetical protein [Polaromonas sp. A23]|uniref:hypothetical protein n=1 Tax=Polaromonas sp. A23 TaxID=1944133 RepID=UPI001438DBB9|nr:hypothetical protein [Polaromonas sp. A23]
MLLFWLFLWTFVDPQLCSEWCGTFLTGLVFLAREMFGLLGVRVLLVGLSLMFIGWTVKIIRER